MCKKLLFLLTLTVMTASAFSQSKPNPAIHKALKDPKRAENSAKADVFVQPKHVIKDSVQTTPATKPKISATRKQSFKRKPHSNKNSRH